MYTYTLITWLHVNTFCSVCIFMYKINLMHILSKDNSAKKQAICIHVFYRDFADTEKFLIKA